jgi:hypothetical protein
MQREGGRGGDTIFLDSRGDRLIQDEEKEIRTSGRHMIIIMRDKSQEQSLKRKSLNAKKSSSPQGDGLQLDGGACFARE